MGQGGAEAAGYQGRNGFLEKALYKPTKGHGCPQQKEASRNGPGPVTLSPCPSQPAAALTFVIGHEAQECLAHFLASQRLHILQLLQEGTNGIVLGLLVHCSHTLPGRQVP
jgi:hypothetical protein